MIEDKINKLVDHVIKPNPEMDGMPMCPFARAGIDRGEVDFVKQGKDTLIFAEQYIKDFPTGKTLVLCVTDSTDFTQQQLEDFCSKWQPTAIEKNLYLYPSHPDDAAGHLAGLTHEVILIKKQNGCKIKQIIIRIGTKTIIIEL